jgi:dTDP-4-dehydrorhamnose reductase
MIVKPIKILLTGSTGQVGWELHRALTPFGKIIAPTRDQFNLAAPDTLKERIQQWKPDVIINTAAYTSVDQAEDEPELAFTINAKAPRVIAEEAAKLKILLVHYSTDYVFDGGKKRPYTEDDSPNPINVYGESKMLGEQAIQESIEQYLIIRSSWIYSHRGKNFLNTMLKLFQQKQEIKVIDDQIGTPTSARVVAEVTSKMLRESLQNKKNLSGEIYHLTTGGKTTWYGFAKEILSKADVESNISIIPIPSIEYDVKALRPPMSLLDNSKIILDYKVNQPDWKDALALEI